MILKIGPITHNFMNEQNEQFLAPLWCISMQAKQTYLNYVLKQ